MLKKEGSQIIFQEVFHETTHDGVTDQKQQIHDAADELDDEIHIQQENQDDLPFSCGIKNNSKKQKQSKKHRKCNN